MKRIIIPIKKIAYFIKFILVCANKSPSLTKNVYYFIDVYFRKNSSASSGLFNINGVKILARTVDWYAFDEVIMHREYAFIDQLLKGIDKPIILDLGANVGFFSIYAFSLQSNCIVHSVEAGPETYEILKSNQEMNPNLNWKVYHYAIFDKNGEIWFDEGELSTGGHITTAKAGKTVRSITIKDMINLIDSDIDILKVDIEGAEEKALLASNGVLNRVRHLIIEVHPKLSSIELIIKLLKISYQFIYEIPERCSGKPLLLATNFKINLPLYKDL